MKPVALITGAAGGIGRATAAAFTEAGWQVVGVDQRQVEEVPGVARFVQADLADPQAPERIVAELAEKERRLDALVNNAAVVICKPLAETGTEEWDRIMAVNARAAFLFARAAYPMLADTRGAMVNVSSVHAVATSVNIAAYAATKGALLALTRALAIELGKSGVRVNAVLPGAVDTPMLHEGLGRGVVAGGNLEELVQALGRRHAVGRVGRPEEIARAILFLAESKQSSFMTGQALIVDGGATARLSTE